MTSIQHHGTNADCPAPLPDGRCPGHEAQTELDALRAERDALRAALLDVVDELQIRLGDASTKSGQRAAQKLAKARAALAQSEAA